MARTNDTHVAADPVEGELRCGVCRSRDLRRGGSGRAGLVGRATIYPDSVDAWPIARTSWRGEDGQRVSFGTRVSFVGEGRTEEYVSPIYGTPQWRCRRGHRLRYDETDVRRQLARGDGVAYLPPA